MDYTLKTYDEPKKHIILADKHLLFFIWVLATIRKLKQKIMKTFTITFLMQFTFLLTANGQDYSIEAKTHFFKYLNTKTHFDLLTKSLPSLDDCKLVFNGSNAYTYFGYVEEMREKLGERTKEDIPKEEVETYVDCRINSFTTYDIQQGKGNYAGGMDGIKDKLQPNVTFYAVTYLREKDAELGVKWKYFVNIKGEWIIFPKPWRVF